jgi:hypothetical protein
MRMTALHRRPSESGRAYVVLLAAVLLGAGVEGGAQPRYLVGQEVMPAYEGWERNADGSFNMVFGYLNRNHEEQPSIPVGANNFLEPGEPDQGQPTHFYPRRQQFVFKVRVPSDWGDKDLIWTVTHNGRTDKAYGSLWPVWEINRDVMRLNRGSGSSQGYVDNQQPFIRVDGAETLTVTLPDPLELAVLVGDDGVPPPNPALAKRTLRPGPKTQAVVDARRAAVTGLAVTWMHWRGAGTVTFDPQVQAVGDEGRAVTTARFSEPGTYVLRAVADDTVFLTPVDVAVTVHPAPAGP